MVAGTLLIDLPALIKARGDAHGAKTPCLGCGADQVVTLSTTIRDRAGFSVVGCPRCSLGHLEPFPTQVAEYYRRRYREETDPDILAERAHCSPDTNRQCEALSPRLQPGCRTLDLGCGSGAFLHAARERTRAQLFGIEPHDDFRAHLRAEGFDVRRELAEFEPASLDLFLLSHVLEHTDTPVEFLGGLQQYLAPNGMVVIEVPSLTDALLWVYRIPAFWIFYWQFPHLWYFSPETLRRIVERAGYQVDHLQGVQRYGLLNHLHWLSEGKPGQGEQFASLVSDSMDAQYRGAVIGHGAFDTIWMECSPIA
jgi:SAM-dependent methyltransferase